MELEIENYPDGEWATFDDQWEFHTLGILPSWHKPKDSHSCWRHHGRFHRESGIHNTADPLFFYLHGIEIDGRMLLW